MTDVKYVDLKGNQRFGTLQSFHEDAEKYEKQGKSVVADALDGQVEVIDTDKIAEIAFKENDVGKFDPEIQHPVHRYGIFWGGSAMRDYLTLEELAHQIRDLRNPNGVHKNTLFYCRVGETVVSAAYVVTDAHTRSYCQVEWRGFCLDKWVAQPWGYGGQFSKMDVSRMTGGHRAADADVSNKKLAIFQEKYADYMSRFKVIPVGMEDLINAPAP